MKNFDRYLSAASRDSGAGFLVQDGIATALEDWRAAIAAAKAQPGVDEVHRLRIAGKRLRYGLEILAELGDTHSKARVKTLRALQDRLGLWHDSVVLLNTCAKFLVQQNFLTKDPGPARALLVEMGRERRRANAALQGLIQHAEKASRAFAEGSVGGGADLRAISGA